jgi:hypothetical protein
MTEHDQDAPSAYQVAQALEYLRKQYCLDPSDNDPLISLPQIAALAGVAPNTPTIWRQRSKEGYTGPGKHREPFPAPDDKRYSDKPQWRAISTVLHWLVKTRRWPRGAVAREVTRGPRAA